MRRLVMICAALAAAAPAAGAADCAADVKAAFEKQRAGQKYRVSMTQPSAEGPVEMTVDYQLPDRMLQTVVSPSMPGEQQTMLVGGRAFAGSGGGFEELLPQFAQSVVSEFRSATNASLDLGAFDCLGKQTFEGKELLAYKAAGKAADGASKDALARVIYVDPASGLPAYNVVAPDAGRGEPVLKVIYSYPTDIDIVAPEGAPVHTGPQ